MSLQLRRFSSSFSSCLDSSVSITDADGEEFTRGASVGAIFLGGNHLGDKGVERIVDGLEYPCRDYYKLYLCDNRIGRLGASFISCSLKYNTSLMELDLGNNHIGDEGAKHLASTLEENFTLAMLNLENNSIGSTGVAALANALERNNASLQWLVLSENPIGDEGANALLQCVRNTLSFDHLQKCNHTLLSIILKKVTQVKDTSTLRKIQSNLKINRTSDLAIPGSVAQRKILAYAKENPNALLEYFTNLRSDCGRRELSLHPFVLALLGLQDDVSTVFTVLRNSAHLFSDDPDIENIVGVGGGRRKPGASWKKLV